MSWICLAVLGFFCISWSFGLRRMWMAGNGVPKGNFIILTLWYGAAIFFILSGGGYWHILWVMPASFLVGMRAGLGRLGGVSGSLLHSLLWPPARMFANAFILVGLPKLDG